MQVTLEDLLSILLSRVDELSVDSENAKSRFNIMFRMLYKKGLFTESDALDALRDENNILYQLGLIKAVPDEETLKAAAHSLMLWITGNAEEIRHSMDDLNNRIKREDQQTHSPKIQTASAAVLNELDRIGGNNPKKLIL